MQTIILIIETTALGNKNVMYNITWFSAVLHVSHINMCLFTQAWINCNLNRELALMVKLTSLTHSF